MLCGASFPADETSLQLRLRREGRRACDRATGVHRALAVDVAGRALGKAGRLLQHLREAERPGRRGVGNRSGRQTQKPASRRPGGNMEVTVTLTSQAEQGGASLWF